MYLVIISSLSLSWVSKLKDGRFLITNSEALLPFKNNFCAIFLGFSALFYRWSVTLLIEGISTARTVVICCLTRYFLTSLCVFLTSSARKDLD
jgi:hypothetical protein